jgi:hypothetical protein
MKRGNLNIGNVRNIHECSDSSIADMMSSKFQLLNYRIFVCFLTCQTRLPMFNHLNVADAYATVTARAMLDPAQETCYPQTYSCAS